MALAFMLLGAPAKAIAAVNDAPSLAAINLSGTEDTTLTFTLANFTVAYTDVESTALASSTVATLPTTGTLKLSGVNVTAGQVIPAANLGTLTYVPALNENGAKTFTVTASDGALSPAAATVTMTLAAVNNAPSIAGLTFQLLYETTNPSRDGSGAIVYSAGYGTGAGEAAALFAASGGSISRIRYRMELTVSGVAKYAEATFDAWSGVTAPDLRVPTVDSSANRLALHRNVSNLRIASNYTTVTITGTGFDGTTPGNVLASI